MPRYPWLPRSVYVQRFETVKQSALSSSLVIQIYAEAVDRETVGIVKQSR